MAFERTLAKPPAAVEEDGRFRCGRYDGPIARVNIGGRLLDRFRLKEWHYTALTTDSHFLAFAIVQLGYAANVFAYVVDRSRPAALSKMERVIPFGRGVAIAPSSIEGETRYMQGGDAVRIRYGVDSLQVEIDLDIGGTRLCGAFDCTAGPGLSIVHALSTTRVAYTYKSTLCRATGTLRFGAQTILPVPAALASIDWTRSLANRTTKWQWASFSTWAKDGAPLGLNLSAEVYDDAHGDSDENAAFDAGGTHPLGGVAFERPRDPASMPWRIRSRHGDDVDLAFVPLGARAQSLDLGVLKSHFVQPYGLFRGRVLGHAVEDAFGVVEDHLSRW